MTQGVLLNRKEGAVQYGGKIFASLSTRELEILRLVAYEYTTSMIAHRLCLSTHTVISHRKNMMDKLDVRNTAGLVRRGFQLGWLH